MLARPGVNSRYHLIEYKVGLFNIKHNVQLTHVFKVLVQGLHKCVDELKYS